MFYLLTYLPNKLTILYPICCKQCSIQQQHLYCFHLSKLRCFKQFLSEVNERHCANSSSFIQSSLSCQLCTIIAVNRTTQIDIVYTHHVGCTRQVAITVSTRYIIVRVSVSIKVYSAVYSIYGKFHIQRPSRHCYSDFSSTPG